MTSGRSGSGDVLGGRYRLDREIARGGMAAVWSALDLRLDRPVAVKLLHPQFADEPEFLERFRREARAAASLNHPNVVSVYDVGEDTDSGAPFIVMELVEGENLKQRIRRLAPFPDADIRQIGAALAATLDYAHRRGLIHRDVKPQNVLLGEDGRPRLTDFGIAQALASSQLTRTGAVMGSVHYLAPELVRGKPASPRSDVYGLGVVLYEMATGRVPFSGDTDLAIAVAHVEETPPAPRTFNAHLDPQLEHVILHCLAKPPEARYQSAADLAEDLHSAYAAASPPRASNGSDANGAAVPPRPPNTRVPGPPAHADRAQPQAGQVAGAAQAAQALSSQERSTQPAPGPVTGAQSPPGQAASAQARAGQAANSAQAEKAAPTKASPTQASTTQASASQVRPAQAGSPQARAGQAATAAQATQAAQAAYAGTQARPASGHQASGPRTTRTATRQAIAAPTDSPGQAAPSSSVRPTRRQVARPGRRGASGGAIVLLLALAAVLVALGAGFFGLASLSREGIATPEANTRPTAQSTTQPTAPSKPAVVVTPTVASAPAAVPTATTPPTAEPTTGPTAAPTPRPTAQPTVPPTVPPKPVVVPTPTATVRNVAVPTLRGRSLDDARAALQAAGLTVIVKGVNENVPRDVVTETTPGAGTPVPPGSTVTIMVGTGNVTVPDIAGRSQPQATRELQDNGFRVVTRERRDPRIPAGSAIETRPAAGNEIPRGAEVELTISSGR